MTSSAAAPAPALPTGTSSAAARAAQTPGTSSAAAQTPAPAPTLTAQATPAPTLTAQGTPLPTALPLGTSSAAAQPAAQTPVQAQTAPGTSLAPAPAPGTSSPGASSYALVPVNITQPIAQTVQVEQAVKVAQAAQALQAAQAAQAAQALQAAQTAQATFALVPAKPTGTLSPAAQIAQLSGVQESNKCTNPAVINFKIAPDLEKCTGSREYLKKLFNKQARVIHSDKVHDDKCTELADNYFNNLLNTWNKCDNVNEQTQKQEILTLKTYDRDYSIKKDDTFLIFDLNEERMNAIKNINFNCDNIDKQTITNFLNDYSMFNQNSLESQIKIGEIIITNDMLQEKLKDKLIKDAFIIKIIDIKDNKFTIEVTNLNNESDKIELIQAITTLNNMNINVDECFKTYLDLDKIKPQLNLMGSMETYYDKLSSDYKTYTDEIQKIKDESIKQHYEARKILNETIEKIKNKIKISIPYTIEQQLNEPITDPGIGEVLVGNKNLLKFIKIAINKTNEVKIDNSMIFKLYKIDQDKDKQNLYYGDYISIFTPYSYTKAYLLLGLVLSNKIYRN